MTDMKHGLTINYFSFKTKAMRYNILIAYLHHCYRHNNTRIRKRKKKECQLFSIV